MGNKTLKGVVISDIHFGIKDSERLYEELQDFLNYLENHEFDILHINGDYFDKKISLNDLAAKYAITFFDKLVNLCIEKRAKLRVIQGTKSHDLDQLEIFYHYLSNPNLDLKIYSTVDEEYIEGLHYLYVPEEYISDYKKYYEKWLENKPDIMMGHGTWDFVAFDNQIIESENHNKSAPVFMYDDWKDIGAFAVFGHIHTRQNYKNKIYYPGSYTRWVFGETKPKGFLIYEIDPETKKYQVQFIENKKAPIYKDISFQGIDIENLDVKHIIKLIEDVQSDDSISKVRVNLDGLDETKQLIIKKALSNNSNIKFKVSADKNFTNETNYKEFSFIEDDSISLAKKIQMYIQKVYNKFLSEEFINKHIVKDDDDE